MASHAKKQQKELAEALNLEEARSSVLDDTKKQLRTVAKVVLVVLVVTWLLAAGFASGMKTAIPVYIALGVTVLFAAGALLLRRNLRKSQEMSEMMSAEGLSEEELAARIQKLAPKVAKGDSGAIIANARLIMQENPKGALEVLEKANLEKGAKMMAVQVQAMRAMIHLDLGEIKAAREVADAMLLDKVPDSRARASFSAVVAEAWARTGNPIEATDLLDKYDASDAAFKDARMQLLRARAFTAAHRNDLTGMKRALKGLTEISPQLLGIFAGQKRVHPLLMKEARKRLEKSGMIPRPKVQMQRR